MLRIADSEWWLKRQMNSITKHKRVFAAILISRAIALAMLSYATFLSLRTAPNDIAVLDQFFYYSKIMQLGLYSGCIWLISIVVVETCSASFKLKSVFRKCDRVLNVVTGPTYFLWYFSTLAVSVPSEITINEVQQIRSATSFVPVILLLIVTQFVLFVAFTDYKSDVSTR